MFSGKFEKSKDNSKTKSKPKSKGHRFAETKAKKTDRQLPSESTSGQTFCFTAV